MEPEVKQDLESPDFLKPEEPDSMSALNAEASEQWRKFVDKTSDFLSDMPDYLGDLYGRYKRPIVTVGLILGSVIAVRLVLAILSSINDIPLLSPTFELVGLGYTAWFIYRYLLRASNRKELANDFNELKSQVLGHRNQPPLN